MRSLKMTLLLASIGTICASSSAPAQIVAQQNLLPVPHWKQVGCTHGHPSIVSKKFITRTLRNYTPYTKAEGKKVRHFVSCVATKAKAKRLAKRVDTLRDWRADSVCTPARGNVELGRCMAARDYGWTGAQFDCLYALWSRESGWVTTKANYAGSGAYGIPQALPGSKMGPGWQYDPVVQVGWGLGYVAARYGTPCGANGFQAANDYY